MTEEPFDLRTMLLCPMLPVRLLPGGLAMEITALTYGRARLHLFRRSDPLTYLDEW